MCLCCTRLFLRRRGRAVAIGATASRFPAGLLRSPCRGGRQHRAGGPCCSTGPEIPSRARPEQQTGHGFGRDARSRFSPRCGPLPSGRRPLFFPLLPLPVESRQKPLIACPSATERRPTGPCPLRRRKLRASRLAGGRTFSPKRCPSPSAFPLSLTLRPTAVPDRCRAGRLRDRRPGGRGRLRQRPCR